MNPTHTILILGSSHLAYRLKNLAESKGYKVRYVPDTSFDSYDRDMPTFDKATDSFKDLDLASFEMIYLLDDKDEKNLELIIILTSLKKNLPLTASLFNENIAPHLMAAHPGIRIMNPAKIAAPAFVEALYQEVHHSLRYEPETRKSLPRRSGDHLIVLLGAGFAALIGSAVLYFHIHDAMTWLNALYFVVITFSTVGYGDISLVNASAVSKIVDIVLVLGSTFFIWMIFSFTVDQLIKKRAQLSLGRKKYRYHDHVIVCGLGRLGHFVAEELLSRGERVVIIEQNEDVPSIEYFRSRGADVYVGNARLPHVLEDVRVTDAKAVMSVIGNDYLNLEIGLNARSFHPGLRLILRIFDESMAEKVKETLDIHLSLSMSSAADEQFLEVLTKK